MSPQIDANLQQIQSLDEADRLILEQRLLEIAESEWKREVEVARAAAREGGIDQHQIDNAISELRYGS